MINLINDFDELLRNTVLVPAPTPRPAISGQSGSGLRLPLPEGFVRHGEILSKAAVHGYGFTVYDSRLKRPILYCQLRMRVKSRMRAFDIDEVPGRALIRDFELYNCVTIMAGNKPIDRVDRRPACYDSRWRW